MKRGRPLGTERRNIIHRILSVIKTGYAYEIWRIMQIGYKENPTVQRDVYYNIDKGIKLGLWAPKKVSIKNKNSWEGVTSRRLVTIKKECEVEYYEKIMIGDLTHLVRKTISMDKRLKINYKSGQVKPFKHYFDLVVKEEEKRLKLSIKS